MASNTKSLIHRFDHGISCRRANAQDYEIVYELTRRSIRKEDLITDYLAGRYYQFVNYPYIQCFIVFKDDVAISFVMYFAVDGGRTMIGVAGRTDPEYRNKGVLRKVMGQVLLEEFVPLWPFDRIRGTSINYSDIIREKTIELDNRIIFRCVLGPRRHYSATKNDLFPAEEKDIVAILDDDVIREHLFPNHVITNNAVVYDAVCDNVKHMVYFNERRFLKMGDNGKVSSLSLGNQILCNNYNSWRYNFNYYGKTCKDELSDHLSKHLDGILHLSDNCDIYFIVMLPYKGFVDQYGEKEMASFIQHSLLYCKRAPDILYQNAFEFKNRDRISLSSKM